MKTKRFPDIDYEFRPSSYWEIDDPLQAILANVQGANRRRMIRDFWETGRLEELASSHLRDVLTVEQRARLGAIHPSFMGGEYLPAYGKGEVEIARIELQSTAADVISVRARPVGKRVRYSISDEYDTEFRVSPASSMRPLKLEELVSMIDGAGQESLAIDFTLMNYEGGEKTMERLDDLKHFTAVESSFYLHLSSHYERLLEKWYREEKKRL